MDFWEYIPDSVNFAAVDLVSSERHLRHPTTLTNFDAYIADVQDIYTQHDDLEKPIADFPYLTIGSELPVFSQRALGVLHGTIQNDLKIARLRWINQPEVPMYAVFVSRIVNCLDMEKSSLYRFANGRLMGVKQAAFKKTKLKGVHMFRLPDLSASPVYVSNIFKTLVEENDLSGLTYGRIVMEP